MTQRHPIQNDTIMLITTITRNRSPLFTRNAYALEAIEMLYRIQELHPFWLHAFVVMPDHVHILLKADAPQTASNILNRFKMGLSHSIGIGPLWQRRFHIRECTNPIGAKRYIHRNPVVAGLVEFPEDYPWSSACGRWDIHDLPMQW